MWWVVLILCGRAAVPVGKEDVINPFYGQPPGIIPTGKVLANRSTVEHCLATPLSTDCPACPGVTWTRDCLLASITPWTHTFQHIVCCLKCCIRFWVQQYGINVGNLTAELVLHTRYLDIGVADLRIAHEESQGTFSNDVAHWACSATNRRRTALISSHQGPFAFDVIAKYGGCVLPHLSFPTTLLLHTDMTFPRRVCPDDPTILSTLDKHPMAGAVFTTNPGRPSPKVFGYPRLIQGDYNTWGPLLNGSEVQTDSKRPQLMMCTGIGGRRNRRQKLRALRKHFDCDTTRLVTEQYINTLMQTKFVASPSGHGHNCKRDWEAVVTGSIPIVDRIGSLKPLREDLPMLDVVHWDNVNASYLEAVYRKMTANRRRYDLRSAYFPYWFHRLTEFGVPLSSTPAPTYPNIFHTVRMTKCFDRWWNTRHKTQLRCLLRGYLPWPSTTQSNASQEFYRHSEQQQGKEARQENIPPSHRFQGPKAKGQKTYVRTEQKRLSGHPQYH